MLILKQGRIAAQCNLEEERRANRKFVELEPHGGDGGLHRSAPGPGLRVRVLPERRGPRAGQGRCCRRGPEMRELFRLAAEHDVQIRRMNYRRDSLEDIFLAAMKDNGGAVAVYKRAYRPVRRAADAASAGASWSCRATRSGSLRVRSSSAVPGPVLRPHAGRGRPSSTSPTAPPRGPCWVIGGQAPRRLHEGGVLLRPPHRLQGVARLPAHRVLAPVLVSPDLVNGALPLYLSRPFSRAPSTCSARPAVLLILLSLITWVPGLLLFARCRRGSRPAAGAWRTILRIRLRDLRRLADLDQRPDAAGPRRSPRWSAGAGGRERCALVRLFFMGSAFGEIWREVLREPWGRLTQPAYLIALVWPTSSPGLPAPLAGARDAQRTARRRPAAVAAWLGRPAACARSLLLVLNRRLRAREVVS